MVALAKFHWQLWRNVFANVGSFLLLLGINYCIVRLITNSRFHLFGDGWIVAALYGVLYTQMFEWFWHYGVLHVSKRSINWCKKHVPPLGNFLEAMLKGHIDHHKAYAGENIQSRDPERLQYIISDWYIFPALMAIHYAASGLLAWKYPAYADKIPAFFFGVFVHYSQYEWLHYWTHIKDNLFDAILTNIPVIGWLRVWHINYHVRHHEIPYDNFNFTPPCLGDLLRKLYRWIRVRFRFP